MSDGNKYRPVFIFPLFCELELVTLNICKREDFFVLHIFKFLVFQKNTVHEHKNKKQTILVILVPFCVFNNKSPKG